MCGWYKRPFSVKIVLRELLLSLSCSIKTTRFNSNSHCVCQSAQYSPPASTQEKCARMFYGHGMCLGFPRAVYGWRQTSMATAAMGRWQGRQSSVRARETEGRRTNMTKLLQSTCSDIYSRRNSCSVIHLLRNNFSEIYGFILTTVSALFWRNNRSENRNTWP